MYKIIIQRENNGEGQELWRRVADDFFESQDVERVGKFILDMFDTIKEAEGEQPF